MFLYVPKLLIRPLEAFLLGPKCNGLLCSQARTFQRLHEQRLFASVAVQGYVRGEGRPDLGRMFQFSWVLADGGPRGEEEEEEAEEAKTDCTSSGLGAASKSGSPPGRIPESRILALRSAALSTPA